MNINSTYWLVLQMVSLAVATISVFYKKYDSATYLMTWVIYCEMMQKDAKR